MDVTGDGEGTGPDRWPLTAFATRDHVHLRPEPASARRAWMDATPIAFARRCLPMVIANQAGWVVPAPFDVRARWDGSEARGGLEIDLPPTRHLAHDLVGDHFGVGVLTFNIPYVFRTRPGTSMVVRGAPNFWIDGASPLEGIVETDWASATFTMNWKIIRPHEWVTFHMGDPVCFLQPIDTRVIERAEPTIVLAGAGTDTQLAYGDWSDSRTAFLSDRERPGWAWQKDYFLGRHVDGELAPEHRTSLRIAPFETPD